MTVGADERCVDCELEFARTRRRIAGAIASIVLFTVIFLPVFLVLLWSGHYLFVGGYGITAIGVTALAVGIEISIGGILYRARRSRFLVQGGHPQLLGGLEVPIAPAHYSDRRVSREFWDGRSVREPPLSPIWARTYGH